MDYLQYNNVDVFNELIKACFKPYYKWIIFNTKVHSFGEHLVIFEF